jgi:hypothetical protein
MGDPSALPFMTAVDCDRMIRDASDKYNAALAECNDAKAEAAYKRRDELLEYRLTLPQRTA